MKVLENKETTIGDNYYVMTAMGAMDGLDFMNKLFVSGTGTPPAKDIRDVIVKYVKLGGKAFDNKSFDVHFSKKYDELYELFQQFCEFNFGEASPNQPSDTEDSES